MRKKDGLSRHGSPRLELPPPSPADDDNIKFLRAMVERRRAEDIDPHGIWYPGEEPKTMKGKLESYGYR